MCWTSNRNSQEVSQLYLASWSHNAALKAIYAAPRSQISEIPQTADAAAELTDKTEPTLRQHVQFLADDALQGRMTGTDGAKRAADYIAAQFMQRNLKPAGEEDSYFQTFEFTAGRKVIPHENRFHITHRSHETETGTEFTIEKDFLPLSFSRNGGVEGEVVFVGYGLPFRGRWVRDTMLTRVWM